MHKHDEIKFHSDRALAELELASRATNRTAAEAHLRLSSLHVAKMRKLGAGPAGALLKKGV